MLFEIACAALILSLALLIATAAVCMGMLTYKDMRNDDEG
jgi:hypothetical protein